MFVCADKVYFDYLQRVKDENETEFPEIEYIMDRFSVLSGELSGLQEKQMKLSAESEQLRAAFQQYTKEQMNLNLGLNNDIARLQKQLEEAEAVTAQLQSGLDADMKNVSDRTTAVSRVVMYQIYFIECSN
jgi:predicted RNase H-like nuclease (RuvC/YqgF family)